MPRISIGRFSVEVPSHLPVVFRKHRRRALGTSFTSTEITLDGHLLILREDTLVTKPEQLADLVGASTKQAKVVLSDCRLGTLAGKMYDSSPADFTWIVWWVRGAESLFCANVQGAGELSATEKEQIENVLSSVFESHGSPKA
jgi:hypothetical protein